MTWTDDLPEKEREYVERFGLSEEQYVWIRDNMLIRNNETREVRRFWEEYQFNPR